MSSHKLCQYIIKKYIQTNINWPREIKIAQKLIKQYKGDKFWNNLNSAKLNSLAWFLTEDGIKFINLELKKQNLKETNRIYYCSARNISSLCTCVILVITTRIPS